MIGLSSLTSACSFESLEFGNNADEWLVRLSSELFGYLYARSRRFVIDGGCVGLPRQV